MITLNTSAIQTKPEALMVTKRRFLTPLPDDDQLLILDNSSIEKWKRCPVCMYNYSVLGREAHAKNAALTFGGAVHCGIEAVMHGKSDEEIVRSIVEYFTKNPTPPDEYRKVTTAIEVIAHYRERIKLPDYHWTVLTDSVGPIIERAFELPLGVLEVNAPIVIDGVSTHVRNIHVAWSGRIDTVVNSNERNRIVDHKTSSIDGEQFVQSFQLSSQTLGYVWAGKQLWPDQNISGFCLNVLRLKKPGKGQGLMDKGIRGGESPLKFFRAYFDYSPERIKQWEYDTLTHVEDFVHCLVRNNFPMNDRHCFDKYGQCPYFDVCSIDNAAIRQRFLASDAYRDVTWNPVNER